jgi:ribosome-binding protein aMBF1 (putative translation factor)
VAEIELHDAIVEWMDSLDDDDDWDRTVVVIDRLATLGSTARMPLSTSLRDGLFELRFTLGPTARRITYRFTKDSRIVLLTTFRKQRHNERTEIARARRAAEDCAKRNPKEETMANYSRWDDIKKKRPTPDAETRAGVEQDLALGQLIYDLRTEAGLSQRELAERMGTTQSVISRLEEGGGARNRIDTLARVATALNRHLVVSFPEKVPAKLNDAVQVA